MDGANQCQPYSLSPKSEYMAGIKSKVELSVLDLRSSVQEMKIEGKRELIDRPITLMICLTGSVHSPSSSLRLSC
jgi:hypothetical protein